MRSPHKERPVMGSPAPKAYKLLDADRVLIEALCPDDSMTHFCFGDFCRAEADEVRVVHCPVCHKKHALMWPRTWISAASMHGASGPGPSRTTRERRP